VIATPASSRVLSKTFKVLILSAIALACTALSVRAQVIPVEARIASVSGAALVSNGGQAPSAAQRGDVLFPGLGLSLSSGQVFVATQNTASGDFSGSIVGGSPSIAVAQAAADSIRQKALGDLFRSGAIALAITLNASPQVVTPASMTSIIVGTILAIDTGNAALKEIVQVTAITGSTFTAIFNVSHGTSINIALMVPVLEIVKLGGPGMKADMKEVTNMLSPSTYKEFIAGLREGGEITFEANYIPKDATQLNTQADLHAGTISSWSLAMPGVPGATNNGIWMFSGFVASLIPVYPLDDRITVTGAIKITGKPVLW